MKFSTLNPSRCSYFLPTVLSLLFGVSGPPPAWGTVAPRLQPVNYSFARPEEAVVRHMDLDLAVDFSKRQITGRVTLQIDVKPRAARLILDTRDLTIRRVTLGKGNAPTSYAMGDRDPSLGTPLVIDISPETRAVNIDYVTSPDAEAIQWIRPPKGLDPKSMVMYTQSEPTLARSWIPCQDNPEVRISFRAKVRTPRGMLALMGAGNAERKNARGVYEMMMTSPIPSYLLALAVGDFEFHALGRRTGVYAQPAIVGRAVHEFADAEKMLAVAESLYGPYRWGRWDILVLPPSYPLGGMENPRLTFVTPTIIAGDRSLVPLLAHELGHSWAGNLVTNATWNDGWLNEGMTTYVERRITETMYGRDRAETEAVLGAHELERTVAELGPASPDSRLYLDLKGRDLFEANRDVIYEKGYLFLRTVEEHVGRRRWDAFLRTYFDRFAFQSMTTAEFLKYMRELLAKKDTTFEEKLQIDAWVSGPGIPSNHPVLRSARLESADAQLRAFISGRPVGELQVRRWGPEEWVYFFASLPDTMRAARLQELDRAFALSRSANPEIAAAWFEVAAKRGVEHSYPAIEEFLARIGRLKYIEPLYRALSQTPGGLEVATKAYKKARSGYHPIAIRTIDSVLKWKE